VQVPRCRSQSKARTRCPINCTELSQASGHHLQLYWLLPLWIDKPWFLTEGKPCCYIHHTFLLGFLTGRRKTINTVPHQNIIPKIPEAALVAAQAYLHMTRPSPGDPREHMHRAALQGLKMVGNKLSAKEEEAYHNKGIHKPRSPCHHDSPRHRSGSR
jgi:hypothetical protein